MSKIAFMIVNPKFITLTLTLIIINDSDNHSFFWKGYELINIYLFNSILDNNCNV